MVDVCICIDHIISKLYVVHVSVVAWVNTCLIGRTCRQVKIYCMNVDARCYQCHPIKSASDRQSAQSYGCFNELYFIQGQHEDAAPPSVVLSERCSKFAEKVPGRFLRVLYSHINFWTLTEKVYHAPLLNTPSPNFNSSEALLKSKTAFVFWIVLIWVEIEWKHHICLIDLYSNTPHGAADQIPLQLSQMCRLAHARMTYPCIQAITCWTGCWCYKRLWGGYQHSAWGITFAHLTPSHQCVVFNVSALCYRFFGIIRVAASRVWTQDPVLNCVMLVLLLCLDKN